MVEIDMLNNNYSQLSEPQLSEPSIIQIGISLTFLLN